MVCRRSIRPVDDSTMLEEIAGRYYNAKITLESFANESR